MGGSFRRKLIYLRVLRREPVGENFSVGSPQSVDTVENAGATLVEPVYNFFRRVVLGRAGC